jgi:Na+-transporting NADH:ubiquinone oxidoreductase subunit NqrF
MMKAGIFYTGSGPILLLTSYNSLTDPKLIKKLGTKGIKKFIAYEVSEDLAREKYGNHYHVILEDLHQEDDLRVLDYDGHHIFNIFSFKDLREPIYYEP